MWHSTPCTLFGCPIYSDGIAYKLPTSPFFSALEAVAERSVKVCAQKCKKTVPGGGCTPFDISRSFLANFCKGE
jgi:hypothetical protein